MKDRLIGLVPIAGLTETAGAEGGELNCANPGISAANARIVRPPPFPELFPEFDELPVPAAASGLVPVGVAPVAVGAVVVTDDGATLMVASGAAVPTLLLSNDDCLDEEVVLSLGSDGAGVGTELTGAEADGEGTTDTTGAFCGFRISRCGLGVEVCASFF